MDGMKRRFRSLLALRKCHHAAIFGGSRSDDVTDLGTAFRAYCDAAELREELRTEIKTELLAKMEQVIENL